MTNQLRNVNLVSEDDIDSLRAFLDGHGYRAFEIDGEAITDAETFFAEGVSSLPQDPPLSGRVNWDALRDSLWGGLDELGAGQVAFVWTHVDRMLEHGLGDLLIAVGCFTQLGFEVATKQHGISQPVSLLIFLLGKGDNFRPFGGG
jgi:hypothetical protein